MFSKYQNAAYAIKLFDVILQKHPNSSRSLYGKAQALDLLADKKRCNNLLQQAIAMYLQVLHLDNVPDKLFESTADRCIDRMRFIGNKFIIIIHTIFIRIKIIILST